MQDGKWLILLLFILSSCAKDDILNKLDSLSSSKNSTSDAEQVAADSPSPEMLDVNLEFDLSNTGQDALSLLSDTFEEEVPLFSLATTPPTSFVVKVVGCSSGYTASQNTAFKGTSLKLYKTDSNCVIALESFVLGGVNWAKQGGGTFSGAGTANFVSGDLVMTVTNPVQLPQGLLAPGKKVTFNYRQVVAGAAKYLVNFGQTLKFDNRGELAPNFDWFNGANAFELTSIQQTTKLATFSLKLECRGAWVTGNPLGTSDCYWPNQYPTSSQNTQIDSLRIMMIKDTFNNGAALSKANLDSLFNQNNSTPIGSSNIFLPLSPSSGGITVSLTTSESILTCRSWLILLQRDWKNTTKTSYTVFNVDLGTTSTTCL